MRFERLVLGLLICVVMISSACNKQTQETPTPAAAPTSTQQSSSPQPAESPIDSPMSPPTASSPLSAPTLLDNTPFQLDKPILPGATVVSGRGPAGVPILLQDVTFAGPLLASGIIDQNGRFELKLAQPLEARHRIGIALGNLNGTGFKLTDFTEEFHGEGALNVPQVGFYFDTYMINE